MFCALIQQFVLISSWISKSSTLVRVMQIRASSRIAFQKEKFNRRDIFFVDTIGVGIARFLDN